MSGFDQFHFNQTMEQVIEKLNFQRPTEIQQRAIPEVLAGKSVIGQSQTGSGKTHAFLLPLFQKMDVSKREVQFVITTPTRELAIQIYDEVRKIIHYANKEGEWIARQLIGGTDKKRLQEELKQPPHIIVGTPGRILDFVMDGILSIYSAKSFVVDEADLMLDLGFIEEIDQLLVRCNRDIQMLAFSATIPVRLKRFFEKYLEHPIHIQIGDVTFPEQLEHRMIALRNRSQADLIDALSKVFHPYIALIFTNGQEQAENLFHELLEKGLDAGLLHGGLTLRERKRFLKDVENLKYTYVIATDLASRGLDIEGVSHVINAELPKEIEFYIHRVGRTARAGLDGLAISFYDEDDLPLIKKLEEHKVPLLFSDLKNSEWVQAKRLNERTERKKTFQREIEREAWKRVKKPKRVKPGYKKKMKQEQERIKRQLLKKKRRK